MVSYPRKTKKGSFQNIVFLSLFLIIFVGVVGALVVQNMKIYQKKSELSKKERELKAQIEQLRTQTFELESVVTESQTQEYQEKVLREQGLFKKPGEEVVTVLAPEGDTDTTQEESKKVWWDPRTWFSR